MLQIIFSLKYCCFSIPCCYYPKRVTPTIFDLNCQQSFQQRSNRSSLCSMCSGNKAIWAPSKSTVDLLRTAFIMAYFTGYLCILHITSLDLSAFWGIKKRARCTLSISILYGADAPKIKRNRLFTIGSSSVSFFFFFSGVPLIRIFCLRSPFSWSDPYEFKTPSMVFCHILGIGHCMSNIVLAHLHLFHSVSQCSYVLPKPLPHPVYKIFQHQLYVAECHSLWGGLLNVLLNPNPLLTLTEIICSLLRS